MWLITAGPTREHLDDVRFLSNASSGRMGYALAAAAREAGHEVVLVSGPVDLPAPAGVEVVRVTSASEMLRAAAGRLDDAGRCDVIAGVAAVCDFRPRVRQPGKPPKGAGPLQVELVENPDVLATLAGLRLPRGEGGARFARFTVGFALEVLGPADLDLEAAEARARDKLERKHLDAIVLNGVETLGAAVARVFWLPRKGARFELPPMTKEAVARWLVSTIEHELDE
jgi:phosphopantothenoylcysteine decarboxylase/phosphopantothenate--cysteine ligase